MRTVDNTIRFVRDDTIMYSINVSRKGENIFHKTDLTFKQAMEYYHKYVEEDNNYFIEVYRKAE